MKHHMTMEWWTDLWLNEDFRFCDKVCLFTVGLHYPIGKLLSSYIKRYFGKNAKTEDLWSVLSEESGVKVSEMMDGWTKEKGYPVISVITHFLSSAVHGDGKWILPITFSLGSYERRRTFLLETKSTEVNISDHVDSSDNNLKNKQKCDEQLWSRLTSSRAVSLASIMKISLQLA
ncbi:hypothetical protein ACFX14_024723 [Malus domestica]